MRCRFFCWTASELQSCATAPRWSNRSIAGFYIRSYEIKLLDDRNICRQFFIIDVVDCRLNVSALLARLKHWLALAQQWKSSYCLYIKPKIIGSHLQYIVSKCDSTYLTQVVEKYHAVDVL